MIRLLAGAASVAIRKEAAMCGQPFSLAAKSAVSNILPRSQSGQLLVIGSSPKRDALSNLSARVSRPGSLLGPVFNLPDTGAVLVEKAREMGNKAAEAVEHVLRWEGREPAEAALNILESFQSLDVDTEHPYAEDVVNKETRMKMLENMEWLAKAKKVKLQIDPYRANSLVRQMRGDDVQLN